MSEMFPKGLNLITQALPLELLKALTTKYGITNLQATSGRTVRFDIPNGKAKDAAGANINRVKITARDDGTMDVRLLEVIEHDLIAPVGPDQLRGLLAGIGLEATEG